MKTRRSFVLDRCNVEEVTLPSAPLTLSGVFHMRHFSLCSLEDAESRSQPVSGENSPVPSGANDSVSSPSRGLKRLTRKLNFRQRQAQANLQVR